MTPAQVDMYLERLPDVEYRANYMLAKLSADIKNMMGGKPEPGEEVKAKDPQFLFSPEEELPWFARAPEGATMSVALAKVIMNHRKSAPSWARKLLEVEEAERVLVANVSRGSDG